MIPSKMHTAVPTNSSPDVDLYGMLRTRFWPRLLSLFPIAHSFMGFKLNGCLIAPYHVVKVVVEIDTSKNPTVSPCLRFV